LRAAGRFHVFVECEDPWVAELAAAVAADALARFLSDGDDPERFRRQVVLAEWLVRRDGQPASTDDMVRALGWSDATAHQALDDLTVRGFLAPLGPSLNFSGLSYFSRSSPSLA
jgi:hypothetical protein